MFDVVIVAGGKSLRAGTDKLSARLGEQTVIARTANLFRDINGIDKIILVTDEDYQIDGVLLAPAGQTRGESVKNGLKLVKSRYVLIHDGARPFASKKLVEKVMEDTVIHGNAVPAIPVVDSLRMKKDDSYSYVDRANFLSVQTPQGFVTDDIIFAHSQDDSASYDDSELYEKHVGEVYYSEGETQNKKITHPYDCFGYNARIGDGFDVHRFGSDKPLKLGGVTIPYNNGLIAHSDGDVVLHALTDALLSAADERDIGVLFPDDDPRYENADSRVFLIEAKRILEAKNLCINNVSVTIIAQKPKLKDYLPEMKEVIASQLNILPERVNLSATTSENLGITAENGGIAVIAMASVY